MPTLVGPAHQRGTILLTVLFLVFLLGLSASLAGQALKDQVQREREDELLWRGQQYMHAIASYVNVQNGNRMYPSRLEDLLRDPRFPAVVRHLRRLYDDPMTGQPMEIVRDAANRVIGVRSSSKLVPFRKEGFSKELDNLRQKNSYDEWEFTYVPVTAKAGASSTGTATNPGQLGRPAQ